MDVTQVYLWRPQSEGSVCCKTEPSDQMKFS